jgi:hypothetical protein
VFDEGGKLKDLEEIGICCVPTPFNIRTFCSALQHGANMSVLRTIISQYTNRWIGVPQMLREHDLSAHYYAFTFSRAEHFSLFFDLCLNPMDLPTHSPSLPLIAFMILHGTPSTAVTCELISELLSLGEVRHCTQSNCSRWDQVHSD